MPKTILITGGRAPVALDLARILGKAGYRLLSVDSCSSSLCQHSRFVDCSWVSPSPRFSTNKYIKFLLKIIKDESVSVLIPTCEETFYISQHLEILSSQCKVFLSPFSLLEKLHHKFQFVELAKSLGLSVPKTLILEKDDQAKHLLGELSDQLVIKPVYSRFGKDIAFFEKSEALKKIDSLLRQERPLIVQDRIIGKRLSSYSVVKSGDILVSVLYDDDGNERSSTAPFLSFYPRKNKLVDEWLFHFFNSTKFTGQIGFDFIVDWSGVPWAIECNPRATSGIHLLGSIENIDIAFTDESRIEIDHNDLRAKKMWLPGILKGDWSNLCLPDVIFCRSDIKPFLGQFSVLKSFWKESLTHRISIEDAFVYDIAWNGFSEIRN